MKRKNIEKLKDIIGAICAFGTPIVAYFLFYGLEGKLWW